MAKSFLYQDELEEVGEEEFDEGEEMEYDEEEF